MAFNRRFFLYDQISGIDGAASTLDTTLPTYIQYLAKAEIIVNKVENSDTDIYRPYVYLVYDYASLSTVTDGTVITENATLESTYISANSNFFKNAEVIFIVMNVVVIIAWIGRFCIWTYYNPA